MINECKVCKLKFKSKNKLLVHLLEIHNLTNEQYHVQYLHIKPIKCKVCGKPTKWSNRYNNFLNYCSKSCGNKVASKQGRITIKEKYGVDNISQIPGVVDKVKQTKKERYGDENYNNTEKNIQTCLDKYGVTNGSKTKESRKLISDKVTKHLKEKFNEKYYLKKYKATKRIGNFLFIDGEKIHINKYNFDKKFNVADTSDGFKNFYKQYPSVTTKTFLENHFPKTNIKINKSIGRTLQEKKYIFANDIKNIPVCPVCKIRPRNWSPSAMGFYVTCGKTSCIRKSSGGERELKDFIEENTTFNVIPNYRINNVEFDVYIPELFLAFEYNGLFWHSEKFKDKNYHKTKTEFARLNGIQLMHVWEDDWMYKQEILKSIILNKLGKSKRIFARKCKIVEISSKESKDFMNENHLQGSSNDSIRFGLMYNDEIISIMTFGKTRIITNRKGGYELLRFANKKGFSVTGGASRLLKQFTKNISHDLISYANVDISDGNLYKQLGFTEISVTSPGYWWILNGKKYHRSNFMKHKLVQQGFDETQTEKQIMESRGYYRVWDSGNYLFKL